MPLSHSYSQERTEKTKMETQTQEQEEETKCDKCLNAVGDNVFETDEGDYICQDCFENANEQIENLYSDR